MDPNQKLSETDTALSSLFGDFTPSIGQEAHVHAGIYCYVKINRWKDQRIDTGQSMFLCDSDKWQVTTHCEELGMFAGVSLQNHRYYWWQYALWLLTRKIRFSPVRYVFIKEA